MDSVTREGCLEELLDALKHLLESGDHSDLRISTSECVYNVHRAIVCTRSRFFQSACSLGFKEKDLQEIDLPDDCPRCVDCLITYLYTLDYDDGSAHTISVKSDDGSEGMGEPSVESSSSHLFSSLSLNTRVYALAEKYNIQGLKDVAQLKFTAQLKRTCVERQLLSIIEEVYTTTPTKDRGLRDPLVDVIYGDIHYWTTREDFLDGFDRCRDFHSDILRYTVAKDLQKLEAAISTVEDPGCCEVCRETLLLRKWRSRRNNLNFEKYCASPANKDAMVGYAVEKHDLQDFYKQDDMPMQLRHVRRST